MMAPESRMAALSKAAEKLCSETDDLNDIFDSIDSQLAEAGVGVSVWDTLVLCEEVQGAAYDDHSHFASSGWLLGYEKLTGVWGLATKPVDLVRAIDEVEGGLDLPVEIEEGAPVPLQASPRFVRVEAAGRLDALLGQMRKKVEESIADIERAKELIKK